MEKKKKGKEEITKALFHLLSTVVMHAVDCTFIKDMENFREKQANPSSSPVTATSQYNILDQSN